MDGEEVGESERQRADSPTRCCLPTGCEGAAERLHHSRGPVREPPGGHDALPLQDEPQGVCSGTCWRWALGSCVHDMCVLPTHVVATVVSDLVALVGTGLRVLPLDRLCDQGSCLSRTALSQLDGVRVTNIAGYGAVLA